MLEDLIRLYPHFNLGSVSNDEIGFRLSILEALPIPDMSPHSLDLADGAAKAHALYADLDKVLQSCDYKFLKCKAIARELNELLNDYRSCRLHLTDLESSFSRFEASIQADAADPRLHNPARPIAAHGTPKGVRAMVFSKLGDMGLSQI